MLCRLKVEGQTLRWYGGPEILAADSVDFVGFEFILPQDWEGYTLHATFQQADKAYTQVLEDRKCTLPSEIGVGNCGIGLFGYQPGKSPRATTNLLNVQIFQSGFVPDGEYPVPPTPDLYSQLLVHLDSQTAVAEQSAANAAQSAQQAQSEADRAEQATLHPPKISERNTWMIWNSDTGEYEDTGISGEGKPGKDGLGVPVATAEDEGKVPVVQADGTYKLEKPSGGGIDLTGASVGQIPRIAIVDDSGKPTAWEAADISCELIASVTLKESAATVEFTGLNLGVGSYTIIIRNTGKLTGAGLSISLNGITKSGYMGSFYDGNGITSTNISVLGSYTLGMCCMSNGGKNKYMWDSVTLPITSISVFSPYHLTDETKYFSDGTVVEIYRGVINYNM